MSNVDRRSELAKTVGRKPFHCITCSDEGIPMRVVRIDEARELALCEDADGSRNSVEIALIDGVREGDTLLVHAGTALTRMEGSIA